MRVLISGGSSDIGRALVERRLARGDEVAITSSSRKEVQFSQPVPVFYFDLTQPEHESGPLRHWLAGGCDALILSAATRNTSLRKIHEYERTEIQSMLEPNVLGNIQLLQWVLASMLTKQFGRIVFISSLAVRGASRYSLYSTAKMAIEGLLMSAAVDYGENGITANIVRPGVIATERTKRFWKRSAYVDVMKPLIPMVRFGLPTDVAEACDYFLSSACYTTGSVLEVSGGFPQIRPDSLFKVGL